MGKPHQHDTANVNLADRLNVLRAGVLGANDGIVSTAGLVIGVAGATADSTVLLISGLAGLVAGALSMAGGEYVSVSSQRDMEQAEIEREKWELQHDYPAEVQELSEIYQKQGLSKTLANQVAEELMQKNALAVHAEMELNIKPGQYVNPWQAAFSSMCSFSAGALLPLLSIVLMPEKMRVAATFVVVLLALALTGWISAALGHAHKGKAVVRNVLVGLITMVITYSVGYLIKA